jgi:putative N6-adenine-specific DNA methylase
LAFYYVACTLGLEEVLAYELRELGANRVEVRRGACAFEGDPVTAYRACLWLRSAIRVQEELIRGPARSREELYELTGSVDWSLFIEAQGTLAIDGSVRDCSWANDTRFPVLVVKDSICDQFRHFDGVRPNVERDRPDLPLKLVLQRDEAIIYRELGGEPLHKRGYHEVQHKSPLNEALTAGLLHLAEWDPSTPLVDPMCGSATFLIEAAWMAMDRAPGLGRAFAFERWKDTDQNAWQSAFDEAEQRATAGQDNCPLLSGNDNHEGAIAISKIAIKSAGLQGKIHLNLGDARDYKPPFEPAMICTNPPYGERLQADDPSLTDTWDALGNFLHSMGGGQAHVLCGASELTRHLGLRTNRKFPVRNGPIDCRWLRYELGSRF